MRLSPLWIVLFVAGLLTACAAKPPISEYSLARAAMDAAREVDSARFAPSLWYEAEEAYRSALRSYQDRHFTSAQQAFDQARILAEKAENASRLARFQSGESAP